jgi:pSer/pThr/pTyr-binding forkhead associated (FHA) protein
MQICNNCNTKQFDGTIFCAECGASMLLPNRDETTVSLGQPSQSIEVARFEPFSSGALNDGPIGPSITLVVMNSGRRIHLDVSDDLLIGRKDNARGIFPDVDLGLDGGFDAGVSRRHAILSHLDGVYRIEDLGSANGTFINGQRLAPQSSMPIASGDELKCGTLLLRVELA